MSSGPGTSGTKSSERPGARRPRRRSTAGRIFRGLAWTLVLALVVGMSARPVYRGFKSWRSRRIAQQLENLPKGTPAAKAFDLARAAVRLAPDEPAALRAAARLLGSVGSEDSVRYWQQYMAAVGPAVLEDERKEYVEAALNANRLDLARPALAEMVRKSPKDPKLLRLLVRQNLLLRDIRRATTAARLLLSTEPGNRRFQLILGTVLLESAQEAARAEGRRLLWMLAVSPGEGDFEAAAALAEAPELKSSEATTLLRRLRQQTPMPVSARLAYASARLRFPASVPGDPVSDLLEAVPAGADPVSTSQVGEWLLEHAPARIDGWLPDAMAETNTHLQVIRCEAWAAVNRWDRLKAELDREKSGLPVGLSRYFRGRIAMAGGQRTEAEAEYRSAVETGRKERRWIPLVARTAEAQGLTNAALAAWESLLDDPRHAVEAARGASRISKGFDDLSPYRRAIGRLSSFFSTDDSFAAEQAVLDVLFDEDVPRATQTLRRLVESEPNRHEWRAALALALLRSGDAGGGLALLEDSSFDPGSASPRARAIHVAVLAGAGQRETARRFARRIPLSSLHLQERSLITPYLASP